MTRPPDLFGPPPPEPPRDRTPVQVPLRLVDQSDKAWLLTTGAKGAAAKWAPKSEVRRGVGRDENLFTMPRWLARERGWL